ncbi:hypothetical protein EYR15_01730 [Hansschlegelia quercus]|uniref:Uncharacterized protein n=2 Tax=Hansschlegelia quercus TaxID=2528245 RepID=A0A4Q9GLP1_9HYPH|nr:hypothetical protein EYR15_01730 [Hansschlegelia quercus]
MLATFRRAVSFPLAIVLVGYEALNALFGPLVRPAIAWTSSLRLFTRIGAGIAALPPYAVLVTLAVPFAVIEPFKFIALYWLASGHAVLGLIALVLSHLSSLLICERIFHVGKPKLLQIGWFALGYRFVADLRDRALLWLRSTAVWRAAAEFGRRIRLSARSALGR